MSNNVKVEMSPAMAEHLIEICDELRQRLGNDGCNDFDMKDTPENRELYDELQAYSFGCSPSDAKQHRDYQPPSIYEGYICTSNSTIFGYFLTKLKASTP